MMKSFVTVSCMRLWQFCAINLTALALTLLGGVVFGLTPALSAALWATDRLDRSAGDLCCGMWDQWRGDFLRCNLTATPPMLVAAIAIAAAPLAGLAAVVLVPLGVLCASYTVAALVTLARLSGSFADARANAALAFALAPYRSIGALLLLPAAITVTWYQPLIGFYFGISVPCFLTKALIAPALAPAIPSEILCNPV